MAACRDCTFFTPLKGDEGECRMNGIVPADRDAERCPSRTFRPKG
jgi:hypothetical protein